MTFYFHKDRKLYFEHQRLNTVNYVIPFIQKSMEIQKGAKVLEIGCGEGGVLKAFLNMGCQGYGVELSEAKYVQAKENLTEEIEERKVKIIQKDIYDVDFVEELGDDFDLIILKDLIEHIHDHQKLLHRLRTFLSYNGHIYFGFPPWYMPFGGHQQICKSKILSRLPYYHLFPNFIYRFILEQGGESESTIANLLEIKETGLSIEHFEDVMKRENYQIANRKLYLINPIYKYKFGLNPVKQLPVLAHIPYVRNLITTCGYYLVNVKNGR